MMPPEVNSHVWYLIFQDLSLDVIRPYLPVMGLPRPEDVSFTRQLQPLIDQYQRQPVLGRKEEKFVKQIFLVVDSYGQEYSRRIADWGNFIYPNQLPLQQQAFRWQLIITRGAKDLQQAPPLVKRIKAILDKSVQIIATELQASTKWDRRYYLEREDEGVNPFEWVEAAVRNYRYRHAWQAATQESPARDRLEEVYQWGLRIADTLRIPRGTLARPEESLALPESLRS